jgi:2-hydroxy-6-oxonona-2,4-dienedioate hydrolase
VTAAPLTTVRTWAHASSSWSSDPRWYTERLTLNGEGWFARIRPGTNADLPPVVMVHGVIISGTYFRPIANLLDPSYAVYIPDLPGIGRPQSDTNWTLPLLTEHLAGWLDAHHITGAVVVGNSFGCQIATLLAASRPDLVRAQVLIAPTLDPETGGIPEVIWKGALVFPREHPTIWATWIPDFFRTGPIRSMLMLRHMFRDDQLARLSEIPHPSWVIGGERDLISPPAWIHRMASRLQDGRAIVIPGAPHALNFSRPSTLVDVIDQAIDAATSGESGP